MSRYSRSVILGRPPEEEKAIRRDLDRQLFGERPGQPAPPSQDVAPERDAANDEDELTPRPFRDRAEDDRRKGARRKPEYAPLNTTSTTRRRPAEEGNLRGMLLAVGTVPIIGLFGAVVWNAYSKGVRDKDVATVSPLLTASGPIKTRPTGEAGEDEDSSDAMNASVFERMEAPAKPEQASAEAGDEVSAGETADLAAIASASADPPVADEPAAPSPVLAETTKPVQPARDVRPPPPEPEVASDPVNAASAGTASGKPVVQKPAPAKAAPVKPDAARTAAARPSGKPAFVKSGSFAVQLAAAPTEETAQGEWSRARRLAPELFEGGQQVIARADVNGRTVYRVRVGYFGTAADADSFCGRLKAKGGQCFRAVK